MRLRNDSDELHSRLRPLACTRRPVPWTIELKDPRKPVKVIPVQPGSSRILLALLLASFPGAASAQVERWLTNPDKSALFQKQSEPLTFASTTNEHPTIEVDD